MSSTAHNSIAIRTTQDVVDAVQQAAVDGVRVSASRALSDQIQQLDLSGMNGLIDYPARDMTVTVEGGMTLEDLTARLTAEGQQLPLDMGDPGMTIGAFVAADLAGPRQYGYGTMRDYLIGMEAVDGQGRVFHAGGRVVKNVAGYDLCRLMTGSRGALGILTQLTFKLKPLADGFVIHRWQFDSLAAADAALAALNESATRPVVIDLEASGPTNVVIDVGVEGRQDVCDWQVEQLKKELAAAKSSESHAVDAVAAMDYCRRRAAGHPDQDPVCVIHTLPSCIPEICGRIHGHGLAVCSHAGNGIVFAGSADAQSLSEDAIKDLREYLEDHGGHLRLASTATGPRRDADSNSTALIDAFDPHHVFG